MTNDGESDGEPGEQQILEAIERLEKRLEDAGAFARSEALQRADADPQIEQLILSGRKIEAIKRYRAESGAALTVAKDHVMQVEQRLGAAGHRISPNRGFWRGVLLLAAMIAIVAAAIAFHGGSVGTHYHP